MVETALECTSKISAKSLKSLSERTEEPTQTRPGVVLAHGTAVFVNAIK